MQILSSRTSEIMYLSVTSRSLKLVTFYLHCAYAEKEFIIVKLSKTLLLPMNDLLTATRRFINPTVSRAGLKRRLRPHGV
jgi:hypothetical protein